MQRILVVWWEIPEEVSFVTLELDGKTADKVLSWHNTFINQGDVPEETLDEMNSFFYDETGHFRYPKIKDKLIGMQAVGYDAIVITGFFL
jgi:hypothetical protein